MGAWAGTSADSPVCTGGLTVCAKMAAAMTCSVSFLLSARRQWRLERPCVNSVCGDSKAAPEGGSYILKGLGKWNLEGLSRP